MLNFDSFCWNYNCFSSHDSLSIVLFSSRILLFRSSSSVSVCVPWSTNTGFLVELVGNSRDSIQEDNFSSSMVTSPGILVAVVVVSVAVSIVVGSVASLRSCTSCCTLLFL